MLIIKKKKKNVPIQHYDHQDEGIDLIVLSHMLYYCKPHFPVLMKKFASWLNKGGIVFVNCDYGELDVQLCK